MRETMEGVKTGSRKARVKGGAKPHGDQLMGERLLYTLEEARTLLGGLATSYMWKLMQRGEIPSVKVGRRRMIARRDLEAYVERLREEAV